jgi:hypothetical protein
MNNPTTTRPRYQGNYPATEQPRSQVHPIKAEIQKNIGDFTFVARFEEDREAIAAFKNEGLIAYRCILSTPDGRTLGIGHGLNVLSGQNKWLTKSVKWAHSGALISAVTNAVKFPDLSGAPTPDFGLNREGLESEFMATDKQKSYLTELIGNMADEDEMGEMMNELSTMSKERASEMIQQLKS